MFEAFLQPLGQVNAVVLNAANRMGPNRGQSWRGRVTDRIGLCRFCRRGAFQHPTRQGLTMVLESCVLDRP